MTNEMKTAKSYKEAMELVKEFHAARPDCYFVYRSETNSDDYKTVKRFFGGMGKDGWGICFTMVEFVVDGKLDTVRVINTFRGTAIDIKIEIEENVEATAEDAEVDETKMTTTTKTATVTEADIEKYLAAKEEVSFKYNKVGAKIWYHAHAIIETGAIDNGKFAGWSVDHDVKINRYEAALYLEKYGLTVEKFVAAEKEFYATRYPKDETTAEDNVETENQITVESARANGLSFEGFLATNAGLTVEEYLARQEEKAHEEEKERAAYKLQAEIDSLKSDIRYYDEKSRRAAWYLYDAVIKGDEDQATFIANDIAEFENEIAEAKKELADLEPATEETAAENNVEVKDTDGSEEDDDESFTANVMPAEDDDTDDELIDPSEDNPNGAPNGDPNDEPEENADNDPFYEARKLDKLLVKVTVNADYMEVTFQDGRKLRTCFGNARVRSTDTRGGKFLITNFGDLYGRYDTPAQVETVINMLKAAITRGDKEFKFPTVDELTTPPFDGKAQARVYTKKLDAVTKFPANVVWAVGYDAINNVFGIWAEHGCHASGFSANRDFCGWFKPEMIQTVIDKLETIIKRGEALTAVDKLKTAVKSDNKFPTVDVLKQPNIKELKEVA